VSIPQESASRIASQTGIVSSSCSRTPVKSCTPVRSTSAASRDRIVPCVIAYPYFDALCFTIVVRHSDICSIDAKPDRSPRCLDCSPIGLRARRFVLLSTGRIRSARATYPRAEHAIAAGHGNNRRGPGGARPHSERAREIEWHFPINRVEVLSNGVGPKSRPVRCAVLGARVGPRVGHGRSSSASLCPVGPRG
jgi:hypothetical protein